MTAPKHIALIGCGFTGTSAFFQLVDEYPVEEITIFEATGDFGPGYPYRLNECPDYLINNTTDTLCLVPSNRRAFLQWLQGRPDLAPELNEKGHLPRAVFGHFLKDVFASTCTSAAVKGIKVNLIPNEVTGMREDEDGKVVISWKDAETQSDAAILTTGRCQDINPFPVPPRGGASYIANHILSTEFDDISLDAEVHIIGASLSAYDVLNRLFSPDTGCSFIRDANGTLVFVPGPNQRYAVLCSRSGRLKRMQSQHSHVLKRSAFTPERIHALAQAGTLDLASLQSLILSDSAANGVDLDISELVDPYSDCSTATQVNDQAKRLLERAIQNASDPMRSNFLVDFFGDAQADLWDLFAEHILSVEDEKLYRAELETAVLCYAAPCPVPTAEKLLALIQAGRLRIVKGTRNVQLNEDGDYSIAHDFGTETSKILVNTIGSVNRVVDDPAQDALTRNLASQGLLSPYRRDDSEMLGADVDMSSFRARNARNIYVANMMLWGPGFFTSSAFMMASIVQRLLASLYDSQ